MKPLQDVLRATEARGAVARIKMAVGSPKLRNCFVITATPGSQPQTPMTTILVGPDGTVDDSSFKHFIADLDDVHTWRNVGATSPHTHPVGGEITTASLQKAIDRTELLLMNLRRVSGDPSDELSLLVAYVEFEMAERDCRMAFGQLGFADPMVVVE